MEEKEDIIFIVVSGILMIILLVMAILLFTIAIRGKRREKSMERKLDNSSNELELLRAVIEAQEIKQERLALNFHNEIGPQITALKLHLSRCYKQSITGELVPEELRNQLTSIDCIMENIQSLSQGLSPQFLVKFGLARALKKWAESITEAEVTFESTLDEERIITKHVSIQLYRLVLDILTNIIRYDSPRLIKVVMYLENELIIEIAHDGQGKSLSELKHLSLTPACEGIKTILSGILILDSKLDTWKDKHLNRIKISTRWTAINR